MRSTLSVLTLLLNLTCFAQPDSITQRIYLIGDGGELVGEKSHPVVQWLENNVNWNDERNTAIFLGDNIYPLGLPMKGEPGYDRSKQIIDVEMSPFLKAKSKAFFIMGNHDWENGKLGGWQRVTNQVNYINGLQHENIKALPDVPGCPGPMLQELNNQVAVVFIDSQWFMYVHDKPGPGSSCEARTVDEFQTVLKDIADAHRNQLLLIVTHHPLYSFGVHGGDYTWKEHLFPLTALNKNLWIPLPILGSIYPISRGVFGNLQDVKHPLYQTMVKAIRNATKNHPNVIMASGHDHSLQLIKRDSLFQIVSGSASNLSRVKENKEGKLLFHDVSPGFVLLEISKNGAVDTKYYNISSKDLSEPTFTQVMRPVYAVPNVVSKDTIPAFPDSVVVAANPKLKGNFWRNLFIGKNYRQEWTTPVKVPVLDLTGYTPDKQGGGKQTHSLRIKDRNGKEWALRSVEKYPEGAIPADLRQTVVKDILADGISASYPFASLSTETFAKAVGVPFLKRRLVYIPDDPRLGRFRDAFKNTLVIMEERKPDTLKTDNTDEMVLKLAKDNDNHVDQIAVLKARLLDNFYMDLDRHEGQWEWASRDTGKGKIFYPIPKDQDQTFFVSQGLVPYFVRQPSIAPELQGFRAKAKSIKYFNKPARNFDRFFLNEVSKEDWSRYADTILSKMTDDVIERALQQQPKEIRGFHYEEIVNKLKERRQYYKKEMLDYYAELAKEVSIVGTNKHELFTIDKLPEGKLHLTINKIDKDNNVSSKIYDRTFDEKETHALNLYGLEDRDSFVVKGGPTNIKVRIVGGPGDDAFVNESNNGRRVRVYDVNFEENNFSGNVSGFINHIGPDPRLNQYNRLSYKYDFFDPGLQVAYNVDDGLFLGLRGEIVKHGFRTEPYSVRHVFRAAHALKNSSYFFGYNGEFIKAIGTKDLLVNGELRAPVNVTNFYGIGNNTVNLAGKTGYDEYYYRARYNTANVSLLLRQQLQSWMRINYGVAFEHFHVHQDENANKFIGHGPLNGVDNENIYKPKFYAGPEALVDISSKDNANVPTRGFVLNAGARSLFGLNNQSNRLTQLHWDMSVFISTNPDPIAVYAVRLGVAHNIGAYEIPQAQYLSGTDNLRGFRRDRFAGRTMLFNNTEVRIRLAEFNTFLFPGALGILVFNDVGRVWADAEQSHRWHDGYGGGIWIAPIKRWVATVSLAHSEEEKLLPYFSLGFRF